MTLYQITGTVVHHTTDREGVSCNRTIQIPTFFLNADIQGIVSEEHAIKIATGVVRPFDPEYEGVTVNLHAMKVTV